MVLVDKSQKQRWFAVVSWHLPSYMLNTLCWWKTNRNQPKADPPFRIWPHWPEESSSEITYSWQTASENETKTLAAKEEPKPDTCTQEVTSQDTNSAIVIKKELVQEEPVEISGNSNFDVEQAPEIDIPAQVRTPSTVKPKPNKATNHYIQLKAKIKQLEPLLMPKHKQLLRDDKSVHFYTNLPNIDTFKTICNYVKSRKRMCPEAAKPKQKTLPEYWVIRKFRARVVAEDRSLCLEDQILLTLMKLRLDLLHQDLANR